MLKVSAVIITHNRKHLVMRAINSVLEQSYPDIECIVVDDASSDGTIELLSHRDDIKYIYIPKEESRGGNYARNVGVGACNGTFVAFLDDDDYWLPTKIEKQVALIKEKNCGVVYCGMRPEFVMLDGSVKFEDWLPSPDGRGDMSVKILNKIYLITSGMLVNKQLLLEIGGFDDNLKYWQEYELSIRLAQLTDFYPVDECLYVYRIDKKDTDRLSNKYDGWKDSVKYVHNKHNSLYKKLPLAIRIDTISMYNREARNRALDAGYKWHALYHKVICAIIKRVRMIIK